MKRNNLMYILLLLSVILVSCDSKEEKEAADLYRQATSLIKLAQETEKSGSYVKAHELYKEAMRKLDTIKAEFSSTEVWKGIANGNVTLGEYRFKEITPENEEVFPFLIVSVEDAKKPLTYSDFRDKILPDAKLKSEADKGDPLSCVNFFNSILPDQPLFSFYTFVITQYLFEDELENALDVVKIIRDDTMRSGEIRHLFSIYKMLPASRKTPELLDRLKTQLDYMNNEKLRAEYCFDLAWEYMKSGDRKTVEELINKTFEPEKKVDREELKAERYILQAALANLDNQTEAVHDLLGKALDLSLEDSLRKGYILSNIALEYKKAGEDKKSDEVYTRAESKTSYKFGYYSNNAEKLAMAGFFDDALKMAEKSIDPSHRYKGLEAIARAYSRNGDENRSIEILESFEDPFFRAKALINKAYEYIDQGKRKSDSEMLLRALNAVEKIELKDDRDRSAAGRLLEKIATGYAKAGQCELALGVINRIDDPVFNFKTIALGNVALEFLKAGELERVRGVISDLSEGDMTNDSTLYWLGKIYFEMGEYDKTLEMVRKLKKTPSKYSLCSLLAGKYIESGDYDRVLVISRELDEYDKKVVFFGECAFRLWLEDGDIGDDGKKLLHDMIFEFSMGAGS